MKDVKLPPLNLTTILVIFLIGAAFFIGSLTTKVQYLEKNPATTTQPTQQAPQPAQPTVGNIRSVDVSNDHIRGNKDAKVTLVEYSDFECPFCKRFHPTMQQAMQEYGDKIRWVYRHFPLDSIHPRARPAAIAAECVASIASNDKFWEYTDKLFEISPDLSDEQLKSTAAGIGVDSGKFASCYSSKQTEERVNTDSQDGQAGGITGTPGTIVIDGKGNKKLIPGALPYKSVKQEIEAALKS